MQLKIDALINGACITKEGDETTPLGEGISAACLSTL
jgi:hypothetical protein